MSRELRVPRKYTGDLHPSMSDDFVGDFNRDRANLYYHVHALQRQVEILSDALFGKGLLPNNPARLYFDTDVPGRVYLEEGCLAFAGVIIETREVLFQSFELGQYVFLSVDPEGNCLLVTRPGKDSASNEVRVGYIDGTGAIQQIFPYAEIVGLDPAFITTSEGDK